MSRAAAVIAERDRAIAAAERRDDASTRASRRARFIRVERLSVPEAAALPAGFDPGPDYDLVPTQERPAWN